MRAYSAVDRRGSYQLQPLSKSEFVRDDPIKHRPTKQKTASINAIRVMPEQIIAAADCHRIKIIAQFIARLT